MSLTGLGTDIVAVARIEKVMSRHGDRFLSRCFRPEEATVLQQRPAATRALSVAGRWAAKEAFLKALGGRIGHIPYGDIAVVSSVEGQPGLHLSGAASEALAANGGQRVHLSISHEREYAVATVVIER